MSGATTSAPHVRKCECGEDATLRSSNFWECPRCQRLRKWYEQQCGFHHKANRTVVMLQKFCGGRFTRELLEQELGLTRNQANNVLRQLLQTQKIERVGYGEYELV